MFARWQCARLKAAENALNAGSLDEAYNRLSEPEIRTMSRAAALLERLARQLFARARLHAQAGRYLESLSDLDGVRVIEREDADVQTLRQRVEAELQTRAKRQGEHRQ